MALPSYVVLRSVSVDKYLQFRAKDTAHPFLQAAGDEAVSPYAKFEIQESSSGNGLVNVRCCYNNKYWVREGSDKQWIRGMADQIDEDQTKWSCTLFRPVVDNDAKTIQFQHVQFGYYASIINDGQPFVNCLSLYSAEASPAATFKYIDWESLLILPKYVAFKGYNGKYLQAYSQDSRQYLQLSADDAGDARVSNEVFITNDGSIRVKNQHVGKFWRLSPGWIWVDSTDTTTNNKDTLFWPVKVSDKVVALRNLGNNNFCKSLTADGKTQCLNATVSSITTEARLEVKELVVSRQIRRVIFRPVDARIYNQVTTTVDTQYATNNSDQPNTMELKFKYAETTSRVWNSSVSLKLGITTSFQTGVPFIADGKIEIATELEGWHQWGKEEGETNETESTYTVTVPKMSKMKVSLTVTRGSCDVPFSYTQRDTLFNGEIVIQEMNDGIYTGVNTSKFSYDVTPASSLEIKNGTEVNVSDDVPVVAL